MSAPAGESAIPAATPGAPAGTPPAAAPTTPAAPTGQQAAEPVTPTVVPPGAQVAGQPPAAAPAGQPPAAPESVEALPDWAQKIINEARKDAGDSRIAAKNAADAAKTELAQQIGKALGLVPDGEPADPAKLTEQLTAAQQSQRDALVELAVYRAAGPLGAKPDALLDSRSFLTSIKDVDPTDGEAIKTAVTAAITANPLLKTQAAPAPQAGASGADFTGGTGGGNGQLTRAQLATMSPADIVKAMKEGRADALLKGHNA